MLKQANKVLRIQPIQEQTLQWPEHSKIRNLRQM
jgi:hypothetical protein